MREVSSFLPGVKMTLHIRIWFLLAGFILLCFSGFAQKQDNVWCMGNYGGVNFNTSPPATFLSKINSLENTASVSDRHTGTLLFYTDGYRLWDASHNVMQNGTGLGVDSNQQSTVQGAAIVPFIHDESKYYVFVLSTLTRENGQLFYSVVDMTLNNGLGGVVPGIKKIQIGVNFAEGMTVLQGCEMAWVVTQNIITGDFYAYKVSKDGVNHQPVISSATYPTSLSHAVCIKASPDYRTIATASAYFSDSTNFTYLALHDFNAATGKIINGRMADTTIAFNYYNCEFSPNGKYIYSSRGDSIFQHDITLPTKDAITASKMAVGYSVSGPVHAMQLRSDGNIYTARYGSNDLGMITNCDARPPYCTYKDRAVRIGGGANYTLPAWVTMPKMFTAGINTTTDDAICNGRALVLKHNKHNITWQDGSLDEHYTVTQPGVYWVHGHDEDCKINTDTFVVEEVNMKAFINNDTTICPGDTIVLQSNTQPQGTTYLWSNGNHGDNITVTDTGTYGLTITYKGCTDADETTVGYYLLPGIHLGNDTTVCNDVKIILPQSAVTTETGNYLWQDGSTGNTLDVTKPGKYFVTISSKCATVSDSITVLQRNCSLYFPGAFTPNGDGKNDIARMLGDVGSLMDYSLSIYNRWGERVYTTNDPAQGWNGMQGASLADIGIYFYQIQYKYKGENELMKGDILLLR